MVKTNRVPRSRRLSGAKSQDGQILVMVGLMAVVLIAMLGLAIDVGRIYITRAELSRDVDAAALSGVLDLPNLSDAQTRATDYLAANDPAAVPGTIGACPVADNCLFVEASKSVDMYFLSLLGFGAVDVSAHAKAGFGIQPIDAYLAIDATGSMDDGCNGSQTGPPGCPIYEAKNAASSFVDTLLGDTPSGYTVVGAGAFRGCYDPPRNYSVCVNANTMVTPLTSSKSTLLSGISNIQAQGGTGTNVCLGMLEAESVVFGSGSHTASNTRRYLILLSDGDNTWNSVSYGNGAPPSECRPSNPSSSDGNVSSSCYSAQTHEKEMDEKTWALAKQLESEDVEIYVVGFGACDGGDLDKYTNAQCDSQIGNNDHDNTADERLLKCIATSTSGTNDHYFYTNSASDLPAIFTSIAQQIAHRLIE